MVQVSYAVWHFQTPYSGFSVLFERRTGRYELTWSESTTLEGSGPHPKNVHVLQHWVLHMFAFMTQSSTFFAFVVAFVVAFFAFIVAFLCICCGISLHLLWHLFYFFLQCSTYMFALVLTQTVNAGTNVSIYVANVSAYASISVNKCINKCII